MSTAAALDKTVAGGISGLREHMEKIREAIKNANEKANELERAKNENHNMLCRKLGKQKALKQKIESTEGDIEKTTKRMKDIEGRLAEKEQFLQESREFNNSLQTVAVDDGLIEDKEDEVNRYKEIYSDNYERYQQSKAQKIELEQKVEFVECKSQDLERKLNALKLELEYNLIEEGRRSIGCKESIDMAFKTEKGCLDLKRGLDIVMKRKEIATKKINEIEAQITRCEDTYETTNFDRRRIEATIRELLLNAKSQYGSL